MAITKKNGEISKGQSDFFKRLNKPFMRLR